MLRVSMVVDSSFDGGVALELEELNPHYFHYPGSGEDKKYLPLTRENREQIAALLELGLKPMDIRSRLNDCARFALMKGPPEQSLMDSLRRSRHITLDDVNNVRRTLQEQCKLASSDVKAVELLVERIRTMDGYVVHYTRDAEMGTMQLILSTPFQLRMLRTFGKELVFADAAYGVNKYGYPLQTLLVRDDHGNGVPIAFSITHTENSESWKHFMSTIFDAAGVDITAVTFMIDKSIVERAAITALGSKYILCIFHMYQEVERFLKSGESGVHGKGKKDLRTDVLHELRELQQYRQRDVFETRWKQIMDEWGLDRRAVVDYFERNWYHDAPFWAAFGRTGLAHLYSDTNNLIERFFGLLKYSFCRGKVPQRLEHLICLLLDDVVKHYIIDRSEKVISAARTRAIAADDRFDWDMEHLINTSGALEFGNLALGLAHACSTNSKSTTVYKVCVGDLSCTCEANKRTPCKHVHAAAHIHPLSVEMMKKCAERLNECCYFAALEGAPEGAELYEFRALCGSNALYFVNALSKTCTCHAMMEFGICAHLFALLPSEEIEELVEAHAPSATFTLERRRRYQPVEGPDPLGDDEDVANELRTCDGMSAPATVTVAAIMQGTKAWKGHVNTISRYMGVLPDSVVKDATSKLHGIAEMLQQAAKDLGTFKPTEKRARKQKRKMDTRQDDDRVQKRLLARKKTVKQAMKLSRTTQKSAQKVAAKEARENNFREKFRRNKEDSSYRGATNGNAKRNSTKGFARRPAKQAWDDMQL